jgi:integrase
MTRKPVARLHALRCVHATTLLRAGVPVHVVAARLGHADPSITLRVYAHVISEQLAEAAVIFARAVGLIDGRQATPRGLTDPQRFRGPWVVAQS